MKKDDSSHLLFAWVLLLKKHVWMKYGLEIFLASTSINSLDLNLEIIIKKKKEEEIIIGKKKWYKQGELLKKI